MKSFRSSKGESGVSRKTTLKELLSGTAPAYIQGLKDSGMSSSEEKKLSSAASECSLCKTSLKSSKKDMEPTNKKVCRVCKGVTCRQCSAHMHIMGHIRRRHVCLKCVTKSCVDAELVPPKVVKDTSSRSVAETEVPSPEEEAGLVNFVSRLWDSWSGWNAEGGEEGGLDDDDAVVEGDGAVEEDDGADKLARMNQLLEGEGDKFDGDAMCELLKVAHGHKGDSSLVLSVPFTKACKEVIKLMAGLGKAFEFAGSDMNEKLAIMEKRTKETASEAGVALEEVTLQMMVEREIKAKTTHAGKKAQGATRTIVRLLWFLDFIGVLMQKLADEPKGALSKILSATYDETLSPKHVWMLRRMVQSGMGMAPKKESFLPKMGMEGLSEGEQCDKFRGWAKTVDAVRGDLWKYMESKGLSEIP